MKIIYLGNFEPEHSTENHVARALEYNGHTVQRYQEGRALLMFEEDVDFVLWTRTKSLAAPADEMLRFMLQLHRAGKPIIGYHLDRWWGLKREEEIFTDPFFQVDLLVTADGGNEQKWADAGVVHHWMSPGISLGEAMPGMYRSDLSSPLAFVGSHDGGYHPESEHRHELVRWLKTNFTRDCAFWPLPGRHAIRGRDLQDLYASVDILIGDSCFTGISQGDFYWSDRCPETLGRAGFLLHPYVEGFVEEGYTAQTMSTWTAFDWDALGTQIDYYLGKPDERTVIKAQGREMVRTFHTYEAKMRNLVELMQNRGLLPQPEDEAPPEPPKKAAPKRKPGPK